MKNIEMKDFLNYHYLAQLKVSPNEKHYALIDSTANHEKNHYEHTLYVGNEEGLKKLRKLGKNNQYVFLNDDVLLLDYQKNKKEEKAISEKSKQSFYTYDLTHKALKEAFTLPIRSTIEAVLDENTLLLSSMLTPSDHLLYEESDEEKREAYLKNLKQESLYEDIDQLPYYFNGANFITDKKKQLFIYTIDQDKLKPLFDKTFSLGTFSFNQDQSILYYTGKEEEKVMSFTSKLYAYHIKTKRHETLYSKLDYSINKIIPLNQGLYVAAKDMIDYGLNQNADFYRVENDQLNLVATFSESMHNSVGSDVRLLGSDTDILKADAYYFTATIDDHTEIMVFDGQDTVRSVYQMDGSTDALASFKDNYLMIGLYQQNLQELYQINQTFDDLKVISQMNKESLKDKYVATPNPLVVKKANHEVKGFVLLPKDYDETKTYPAILNIHGGPKTVYGSVYYHEMQYWANEGYVVLFANPRGSDGKGNQFADIRGKYGTIDYEDLMDFTDAVLAQYQGIDPSKLYVTGGSYGGFMTNWIIGHTNRFKAAVTQRSISNWFSFYGTSDIGYYFASDQTAGHPLDDMDKLYEQSPIKYAKNVKTPLLIVHSDKDHRCPMEQAQQFFAILKTQGLDTKLLWIKDETHELSRSGKPQARIKRLNAITEWFKTH